MSSLTPPQTQAALQDTKYLKQNLARAFTLLCREIFRVGVTRINIEVRPNAILILSQQPRSPIFQCLREEGYEQQAKELGLILGSIFKKRFVDICTRELGLPVTKIFRDYNDGEILTYIKLDEGS